MIMNLKNIITLIALATLLAGMAQAELKPTPVSGDSRLVTFDYDPDNTYLILTKPRAVTHLELPQGEHAVTIAAGDTTNWEITPTKDARNIFVKARVENSTTSMTVITDKDRSYQFVVRATADGQKWYQRVTWRVPQTLIVDQTQADVTHAATAASSVPTGPSAAPTPEVDPEKLHFGYNVSGDAPFRPKSVFDDGTFTWLRMPTKVQELPVMFAKDEKGDYALVNYIVRGDYLVAQRLVDRLVLKLGKQEITISRGEEPKQNKWFNSQFDRGMYGN